MNRTTEDMLDKLVPAIIQALTPNGADVCKALSDMVNFRPEGRVRPIKGMGISQREMDAAPFFSETFLYGLLGKDDARSLLYLMRRLCNVTIGIELADLYQGDDDGA